MTDSTAMFESDPHEALSPEGEARRDAMLGTLRGQVRARGRRRRALQATVVATPLFALAAILGVLSLGQPSPNPLTRGGFDPSRPVAVDHASALPQFTRIAYSPVSTRTDIADRSISDDELLKLLHEAGHDAGLIRREGEVILTGATINSGAGPERDSAPPAGSGASVSTPMAPSLGA